MGSTVGTVNDMDKRLFSKMLDEVMSLQELLGIVEDESVSVEDAIGLVSGIQRDIVTLYRAARG